MKKSGYGRAEPGIYMLVGGAGVPNYGDVADCVQVGRLDSSGPAI